MKIKKTIYPKTKRMSLKQEMEITEKIDGSNLGIFKLDNKLIIATRNFVFTEDEFEYVQLKGFHGWFVDNKDILRESIFEGSGFFGEWLGSGLIKYGDAFHDRKLLIFAKARINKDFEISNLYYNHYLLQFCFNDGIIPNILDKVPLVKHKITNLTKEELDTLYEEYCKEVGRKVEGFIVNTNNNIIKYVRYKNGKLKEHKE